MLCSTLAVDCMSEWNGNYHAGHNPGNRFCTHCHMLSHVMLREGMWLVALIYHVEIKGGGVWKERQGRRTLFGEVVFKGHPSPGLQQKHIRLVIKLNKNKQQNIYSISHNAAKENDIVENVMTWKGGPNILK